MTTITTTTDTTKATATNLVAVSSELTDVSVVLRSHVLKPGEKVRLWTGLRRSTHRPARRIEACAGLDVVERSYLHVTEQWNHFQLLQTQCHTQTTDNRLVAWRSW